MMLGDIPCRYAKVVDMDLQLAELPYRGKSKSLVVLLPSRRKRGLEELKKDLDAAKLDEWLISAARTSVNVQLPKFSFNIQSKLTGPLAAMGCRDAFVLGKADFSRISEMSQAIDEILQSAFIRVDESGTEAAAVTVGFGDGGAIRDAWVNGRSAVPLSDSRCTDGSNIICRTSG